MVSKTLTEIIGQLEALTPEEQLHLIAVLAQRVRQVYRPSRPRRSWGEICGAAPYPLVGEDAQDWVSRIRREGDETRSQWWEKDGQ